MAKKPSSIKPLLKKSESMRERAAKAGSSKQPRRLKRTTTSVAKGVGGLGKVVRRGSRPLGFVLKPFKLRPVKFLGRILSKVLLFSYFAGSWRELRQVKWPNRKETAKLTTAVFMFAIFFATLIAGADYILDKLFKQLILK